MAALRVEGDELVVSLSGFERAESVHGDVRVALGAVRDVSVVDDALSAVAGWKLPGSRLPGVFAVGTFVEHGRRTFAVVHHGTPRGVRVTLEGASFDELLVGCDDPEGVVAAVADHKH